MTPEQKAAFVMAQSTAALIEALGMMSLNMQRAQRGETIAYEERSFEQLIEQYGLGHNTLVGFLVDS